MSSDLPFFALRGTIPKQITSSTKRKDLTCHFASPHPVETQPTNRAGHKPSALDTKEQYMQMQST